MDDAGGAACRDQASYGAVELGLKVKTAKKPVRVAGAKRKSKKRTGKKLRGQQKASKLIEVGD